MASLDPKWAGGRPRRITTGDEAFIVETARTRPARLGRPFTRWSLRELSAYLADNPTRVVVIGPERLRVLLARAGVTFQRTKTWKESNDPQWDAKLDRVEHVIDKHPQRVLAFEGFGPLQIRPVGGSCWAPRRRPQRQRANCSKLHGVRQFCGCYSVRDDELWGVVRRRKSAANTLAALRSIWARRPDGEPVNVILDNLSAHKHADTAHWARLVEDLAACFEQERAPNLDVHERIDGGEHASAVWLGVGLRVRAVRHQEHIGIDDGCGHASVSARCRSPADTMAAVSPIASPKKSSGQLAMAPHLSSRSCEMLDSLPSCSQK